MFDYLVVGAGFAGAVMAERLAADAGRKVLIVDKRMHVGGNAHDEYDSVGHSDPQLRPAYLPHQLARGVRLPQPLHRVATVPAPRAGVGRRPAAAHSDQSRHRQPSLRSQPDLVRARAVLCVGRGAAHAGAHVRRCDREQGRSGAVQQVLSQLHAQAVGSRSVGAGCDRDRARSRTHQPRRSVLHRHLPGHAACTATPGCSSACSRIRTSRSC